MASGSQRGVARVVSTSSRGRTRPESVEPRRALPGRDLAERREQRHAERVSALDRHGCPRRGTARRRDERFRRGEAPRQPRQRLRHVVDVRGAADLVGRTGDRRRRARARRATRRASDPAGGSGRGAAPARSRRPGARQDGALRLGLGAPVGSDRGQRRVLVRTVRGRRRTPCRSRRERTRAPARRGRRRAARAVHDRRRDRLRRPTAAPRARRPPGATTAPGGGRRGGRVGEVEALRMPRRARPWPARRDAWP